MVFVFDADTFAQLWGANVAPAGTNPSDERGCKKVKTQIGITSTPVMDINVGPNGTIYLVAMSKDGTGKYHQRLHALDLATGAEQSGMATEIQATYYLQCNWAPDLRSGAIK